MNGCAPARRRVSRVDNEMLCTHTGWSAITLPSTETEAQRIFSLTEAMLISLVGA